MKIKIDFFSENIIDAIGAGIYQVSIMNNGKEEVLYVGESVFVLVRCGAHLFELKKTPEYFGFNDETINNENIILKFELLEAMGRAAGVNWKKSLKSCCSVGKNGKRIDTEKEAYFTKRNQ